MRGGGGSLKRNFEMEIGESAFASVEGFHVTLLVLLPTSNLVLGGVSRDNEEWEVWEVWEVWDVWEAGRSERLGGLGG